MANKPQKGDRVKLRGREPEGIVKTFGLSPEWVVVGWDTDKPGPKYVHELELEVISHG